jgi:hypothetical protein
MMSKEEIKLALEALAVKFSEGWHEGIKIDASDIMLLNDAAQALAKPDFWEGYVPEPDSTCNNTLRAQGKAYPRTCKKCGFGPCVGLAQQALDKKAENARELGLDYEPAQQEPVACFSVFRSISGERNTRFLELASLPDGEHYFYTSPPAQRTWVGLTDEERVDLWKATETDNRMVLIDATEAKLKEKNT